MPEPSAEEVCPAGVDLNGVLGLRFLTSLIGGGLVIVGLGPDDVCSWSSGGGVVKPGPRTLPEKQFGLVAAFHSLGAIEVNRSVNDRLL